MARIDFDKQIEIFLRKNQHIGARFKEEPMGEKNETLVAIICDQMGSFVMPKGTHIDVQNHQYYFVSNDTGEFIQIVVDGFLEKS